MTVTLNTSSQIQKNLHKRICLETKQRLDNFDN